MAALEDLRARKGYFFSALLVTDVVKQTSLLVIAGSEEFLQRIDYPELEPGIYELSGVVSRKKQLLPYLTHCLTNC
jgi:manganese-dependent inorganic pyrophosphatase